MGKEENEIVKTDSLPVDKIDLSAWNVRTLDKEKGIEELADSILTYGLLQPVVVFKKEDKYELIIGQRRLNAYKMLKKKGHPGYEKIPALIFQIEPEEERLKILSLSENIHRVELNRADIIEIISYLYEIHNKSAKKVAKILGKSVPYIYEHLKIQNAPDEIKEMLSQNKIKKEDVKRVMEIAADDKKKMIKLAKKMKELTAPEKTKMVEIGKRKPKAKTEELIKEAKKPRIEEKVIVPSTPALMIALEKAVEEIGLSREEVVKKALEDWLSDKGYYR
jgi:ParB family chromosome partitioning protein